MRRMTTTMTTTLRLLLQSRVKYKYNASSQNFTNQRAPLARLPFSATFSTFRSLTIDGNELPRGARRREPIAMDRPPTVEKTLPFPHHKPLNFDEKKWLAWVLAQQNSS